MLKLDIKEFKDFIQDNKVSDRNFTLKDKKGLFKNINNKPTAIIYFDVIDLKLQEDVRFTFKYDGEDVEIFANEDLKIADVTIEKLNGSSFLEDIYSQSGKACTCSSSIFESQGQLILDNFKKLDDYLVKNNKAKVVSTVSATDSKASIEVKKSTPQVKLIAKEAVDNVVSIPNVRQLNLPEISSDLEKSIYLNAGSRPIMIYGPAGSGKSWGVENFVDKFEKSCGYPISYYSKLLTKEMDRSDLIGYPSLDGYNYGILAKALMSARDGNPTVCFFDEIVRMKDTSVFFNLFGKDYYSIETGNQIELVQLPVNENQTAWFQLTDTRKAQDYIKFSNEEIYINAKDDDIIFKDLPEQKLEDLSAHGKIPLIHKNDFARFGFENIAIKSFKTLEVIKAPVNRLIILAAANVGTQYVSNFKIGQDVAFDSRWAFCETFPPKTVDYIKAFEKIVSNNVELGYSNWGYSAKKTQETLKKFSKKLLEAFTQIDKLVAQQTLGMPANINYRIFEEMANNICAYSRPDEKALREVVEIQLKSIARHEENATARIPVQSEVLALQAVIKNCISTTTAKDIINKTSAELSKTAEVEKIETPELIEGLADTLPLPSLTTISELESNEGFMVEAESGMHR